ncbi:MAG: acetyl-CoA C-acetyltransferase [Gammaproteobacteria bacterium]
MSKTYILSGRRSAVVPRNGAFAHLSIHELSAPVLHAALRDADISANQVGELVVANSLGEGGNPARSISLAAGIPEHVAGLTIDRQCVGGLDALILADALIGSGRHDIAVAGGVESYSRRPIQYRTFADGRDPVEYAQAAFTPWTDRDPDMAEAADRLARQLGITKAQQDTWAIESHKKAVAQDHSKVLLEMVEVAGVAHDPFGRHLTQQHCDRAPVVTGDITAANMAVAADGAAYVVMASETYVKSKGLDAVEFIAGKTVGDVPDVPGLAPVKAIQQVLEIAQIDPKDLTTTEIMEAFAVQAIACQSGANIPPNIVNPGGGALARGHPIGASGAILAVRLFHALQWQNGYGLAAIAAAGGLGTAVVLRG